jgi:hypothetical protein
MAIVPIEIRAYPINRVPPEARLVLNENLTAAIRQRGTYPVILDSSLQYTGLCYARSEAVDGEIHMRPINSEPGTNAHMRYVYLHEITHRLLRDVTLDLCGHHWTFASMLAILLRRSEPLLKLSEQDKGRFGGIHELTLYDVSDEPEDLRGEALQRAIQISSQLAPQPISAEECAQKIWRIWFNEMEKERYG